MSADGRSIGPQVPTMTPISLVKIAAPAFALVAAGSAAVVFGVPYLESSRAPVPAPTAALTAPSQAASAAPAPAATSEAQKAAATNTQTAKSESAKSEATKSEAAKPEAAKTELAATAAAIVPAPAANPSGPSFDLARIEKGGDAVIAGRAAPGATVDLMRNGERLDGVVADSSGQFVIVPPRLPAGDYKLSLRAKAPDGQVTSSKQNVAVSVQPEAAPIREAAAAPASPRAGGGPQTTSALPGAQAAKHDDTAARPPRTALASAAPDEGAPSHAATGKASNRIVVRGDSLWRISRLTYGAGEQYAIVYRANRNQIRDPNLIRPGQVLILPLKHR